MAVPRVTLARWKSLRDQWPFKEGLRILTPSDLKRGLP
jgi:hypothetical protein